MRLSIHATLLNLSNLNRSVACYGDVFALPIVARGERVAR
jgi:hypothetical protein